MNKNITLVTLALCLLGFSPTISAQIIRSTASGDWHNTATWVGGIVPTVNDSVAIASGHTINVTADASCGALTINGAANAITVNINSGISLTVVKGVIINRATADNMTNSLNVGAGVLNAASIDLRGNATFPTRIARLSISTGTVNVLGNTALAIDGNIVSAGIASEVVFSGAGTINLTKNFMAGANSGTLVAGTGNISTNGALIMAFGGYTYNNLTVAGTNVVQFLGNTVINGTFNNTTNNLNVRVRGNLTSNGTFNAGTGTYTFESTSAATNPVTAQTLTGSFNLAKVDIDTNFTLTIVPNASLTCTGLFNNYGTLVNNGTFTKPSGVYKGSGTFSGSTYMNTAVVAMGDTLGCLTFSNGFDNTGGTLDIDVSGTTPCSLHDQITVNGTAKAAGTLRVDFGNYTPSVGQTFNVVKNATTYVGAFDTITVIPNIYRVTYANGNITVAAITTNSKDLKKEKTLHIKSTLVYDVLSIETSKLTVISIYNISGQVIAHKTIEGVQNIDISHIPVGIYFVRTEAGEVGRFVKR